MIEYVKEGNYFSHLMTGEHDVFLNIIDCHNSHVNQFTTSFQTDDFPLETISYSPQDRLGNVDSVVKQVKQPGKNHMKNVFIVNTYAFYDTFSTGPYGIKLDYDAFRLCLRKVNIEHVGHSIAIPMAILQELGGDSAIIEKIAEEELYKCKVRIITPATTSV